MFTQTDESYAYLIITYLPLRCGLSEAAFLVRLREPEQFEQASNGSIARLKLYHLITWTVTELLKNVFYLHLYYSPEEKKCKMVFPLIKGCGGLAVPGEEELYRRL